MDVHETEILNRICKLMHFWEECKICQVGFAVVSLNYACKICGEPGKYLSADIMIGKELFVLSPRHTASAHPLTVLKVCLLIPGLTDEEVELAIQRSGSTEEVLTVSTVGPQHPVHITQMAHGPHGERTRTLICPLTASTQTLS